MKIKKWLIHFLAVASISFTILVMVQIVKGYELNAALEFALLWSAITASVYLIVKAIKFKRAGQRLLS